MPDSPTTAAHRFPLLAGTRYLVPIAFVLSAAGVVLAASTTTRLVYAALTLAVVALWLFSRARRAVLVVDGEGYCVEIGRRRMLRVGKVRFDEVRRARAAAAEHAMYLDCGDPARNLLLPGRGYGFRFARQEALYALLALRLADRLELVDKLVPDPPVKNGHDKPSPLP